MSVKGWFPDPSGRFGQRWYDGHRWGDQVVAANGTAIDDPLPESDRPYPPPMPTQLAPPQAPPAHPALQQPAGPPPAPLPRPGAPVAPPPRPGAPVASPPWPGAPVTRRLRPGATLGIGLLGLLVAALSLFGVPWAGDGPTVDFLDISEGARNASGDGEVLVRTYAAAGGFVLFALALVVVVLAGLPAPSGPGGAAVTRVVASAVCALAAVLHTVTVVRIFRGPASPDLGAWLGTVGYFIAIIAMVVGHYRRSGPAS